MIKIAVYNQAKTALGLDLTVFIEAMQEYLDKHFTPAWGIEAQVYISGGPVGSHYGMVFLDDADAPGALAYHDEENHMPLAKVFVKTTLADGELLSVSASHELVEMLADATCNRYVTQADGQSLVAWEVSDPVEDQTFEVMGFQMSNFVYPSWFEADPIQQAKKFDAMGKFTAPFQLSSGGYVIVAKAGTWSQVFGSPDKAEKRTSQDRRGHRGWFRPHPTPVELEKSVENVAPLSASMYR